MKWNSDDLYHLVVLFSFFLFFFISLIFCVDGKLTIDVHADLLERSDLSRAIVAFSRYMDVTVCMCYRVTLAPTHHVLENNTGSRTYS
jgi:hypothetical protein